MIKIAHQINTLDKLDKVPNNFGIEIDIRSSDSGDLVLSHDPLRPGEDYLGLENLLEKYSNKFIVANIKESGIEKDVINEIIKTTKDFFLLDVELPFIFNNHRDFNKYLSVRYSEFESIETVRNLEGMAQWVWIDTFTKLPSLHKDLEQFKTCLVSPDRWGRSEDIISYKNFIEETNGKIDAVMSELDNLTSWD